MKQLSGMDAMMVYFEHAGVSQNMTGFYIYDPSTAPKKSVSFDDIVDFLDARISTEPMFRRRLYEVPFNLDLPYWLEDSDIDIRKHVLHFSLPSPGDWNELCKLGAYLHALPLDTSKPLWEIFVIDGLDNVAGYPPGCFAVAQKMHHCMMDGATGVNLETLFNDTTPTPSRIPRAKRARNVKETPDNLKVVGNLFRSSAGLPARFGTLVKSVVETRNKEHKLAEKLEGIEVDLPKPPKTRFQGRAGRERVIDGITLDFNELRAVKSAVDHASVNDVLLTITGGALQRYLNSKNELPEESLVCACPIDIRTEAEKNTGGNIIGSMSVPLHTDISMPLERLAAVNKSAVIAKARAGAGESRLLMNIFDTLPSSMAALLARASHTDFIQERLPSGNTLLSNMPGPQTQYYLRGAKMVGLLMGPPLEAGIGLLHGAISQVMDKKGVITLGFGSTPEMMPDPEFYRRCLRESFEDMKLAAGVTKPTAPKRRRKTPQRRAAKRTKAA
jgi:diacylglycerol O-acyltransferase